VIDVPSACGLVRLLVNAVIISGPLLVLVPPPAVPPPVVLPPPLVLPPLLALPPPPVVVPEDPDVASCSVICCICTLPALSTASTETVLLPEFRVIVRLQFAVLLPDAAPPLAACPLTRTVVIPLPPLPLSVAVPRIVWLADVTTNPDVWLVIVNVGGVRSVVTPAVTVQTNERDTVVSPSFTKMVTLYVPALVGVPVI
jgi:hypothetical protein